MERDCKHGSVILILFLSLCLMGFWVHYKVESIKEEFNHSITQTSRFYSTYGRRVRKEYQVEVLDAIEFLNCWRAVTLGHITPREC